jgi:hypothetical protein
MGVVQEAEMTGRNIFQQRQAIIGVPVIAMGFLVVSWSGKVVGMAAQACELADSTQWAALVVLRWIMLLADCHRASAYLYDNAGLLQYLPKTAGSLWSLLWVLARQLQ